MELVQDEVVIEEPAPIDFNWCEEISNCGDLVLEKDIPATLEEEVVAAENYDAYDSSESTDDVQSERPPATTSKRTKQNESVPSRRPIIGSANPRSLLKTNYFNDNSTSQMTKESKFTKTLVINRSQLRNNATSGSVAEFVIKSPSINEKKTDKPSTNASPMDSITKFKHSIRMAKNSATTAARIPFQSKNLRKLSKQLKKRTESIARNLDKAVASSSSKYNGKGSKNGSTKNSYASSMQTAGGKSGGKGNKRFVDLHGENITINHDVEDTAEEIGRIRTNHLDNVLASGTVIDKSCDTDSDLEIDIETEAIEKYDTDVMLPITTSNQIENRVAATESTPPTAPTTTTTSHQEQHHSFKDYPECLAAIIEDTQTPTAEHPLDHRTITELEKYFHAEFFEGRPTKTPERYMKIRSFILETWANAKPTYVSKTAIRNGLKNCGDVNCIGRIHSLFEQIGAINFGYNGIQFQYIRPLTELQKWFSQSVTKVPASGSVGTNSSDILGSDLMKFDRRQRAKTISESSGGSCTNYVDVNYTLRHDDDGPSTLVVASTVAVDSEPVGRPKRTTVPPPLLPEMSPEFQLIRCQRFVGIDNIAPFKVSITLSTLLCMQLHSLSARHEVMGFLGGYRGKSVGRNKMSLTRYKPCRTSAQNGTMCEMCPVSQVEQSASLVAEGNELLGWFHSHPAFPPNPSRTDVRTQAEMQHQFEKPFIGFILGCVDMKYKYVCICTGP